MTAVLTVLMVSDGRPHAHQFAQDALWMADDLGFEFLLAADGTGGDDLADALSCDSVPVRTNGCVEAVLDEAIRACADGWILRLDDDERVTPQLRDWLAASHWVHGDHWAVPRANLWPDPDHHIANLWPDLQTRLSVKAKAGGRHHPHAGSPFGTGLTAPGAIEHHKLIVTPVEQRRETLARYQRLWPQAGDDHYRMFSVPEDFPVTVTDWPGGTPG